MSAELLMNIDQRSWRCPSVSTNDEFNSKNFSKSSLSVTSILEYTCCDDAGCEDINGFIIGLTAIDPEEDEENNWGPDGGIGALRGVL